MARKHQRRAAAARSSAQATGNRPLRARTAPTPLPAKRVPKPGLPALQQRKAVTVAPTSIIRTEVKKVTPKVAEDWLGRNSHNRTIRNARVAELAGAIERGEWQFNGDAIRFAEDGSLLDGQHRLWAIIESGKAVETLVIHGLPSDTQETMDTGARRNLKDALTLRGEKNCSKLAAALAHLWRQESGLIRNTGAKPTTAQAIALLDRHPGIRDTVSRAEIVRHRFRVSAAMTAVAWYTLDTIDADDNEAFWSALIEGVNLNEGSPVLALRRWLERQASSAVGARASSLVAHALIIKAWNAWREGRHVEQLNWKASGMKAEAFPEPH